MLNLAEGIPIAAFILMAGRVVLEVVRNKKPSKCDTQTPYSSKTNGKAYSKDLCDERHKQIATDISSIKDDIHETKSDIKTLLSRYPK